MLNNKVILITGGTGSFGHAFVAMTLEKYKPRKIIIFSRDEMKHWKLQALYKNNQNVRFFLGDVRDKDRLMMAFKNIDYVIHAAAQKIVPTAEYNPFECVKTNVIGAMNVIEAAIHNNVKKVVALSTDKASSPVNLYGATKLASDKLFVAGNVYSGQDGCMFSVVRYGNVIGSRGSIIPTLMSKKINGENKFDLTHLEMTRFMINLEQASEMVTTAFQDMLGGEIYVKKIPSMKIIDLVNSLLLEPEIKIIGLREGEKLHEQMISEEESSYTFDYDNYYKILPSINSWHTSRERIKNGKTVPENFSYNSNHNQSWMTSEQLLFEVSKLQIN